jgi:hypothetical protein
MEKQGGQNPLLKQAIRAGLQRRPRGRSPEFRMMK